MRIGIIRVLVIVFVLLWLVPECMAAAVSCAATQIADGGGTYVQSSGVTALIDTVQDADCDDSDATTDPEPFGDTVISVKVRNTSNKSIAVNGLKTVVKYGGRKITTKLSPPIGAKTVTVKAKSSKTVRFRYFQNEDGLKYFYKTELGLGIKETSIQKLTVEIKLPSGSLACNVTGSAISVEDVNRCPG